MSPLKYFVCFVLLFYLSVKQSYAQVVRAGLKGGFQGSWINYDDKVHKKLVNVSPVPGFNVGGVLSFKVKDRYFLHTEYLYSTKGRRVTANKKAESLPFEDNVKDRAIFNYISVPVMFTVYFNSNIGKNKRFKWFAGAGPNFDYWLGGKGTAYSESLESEYNFPKGELQYDIKLGDRGSDDNYKHVYYTNINRMQIGLNFSAGLLFEPAQKYKLLVDLRYQVASTRLAGSNGFTGYAYPPGYFDSLKARNHTVSLSVAYLFEFSSDKKVRNKGKSTVKKTKPGKRSR